MSGRGIATASQDPSLSRPQLPDVIRFNTAAALSEAIGTLASITLLDKVSIPEDSSLAGLRPAVKLHAPIGQFARDQLPEALVSLPGALPLVETIKEKLRTGSSTTPEEIKPYLPVVRKITPAIESGLSLGPAVLSGGDADRTASAEKLVRRARTIVQVFNTAGWLARGQAAKKAAEYINGHHREISGYLETAREKVQPYETKLLDLVAEFPQPRTELAAEAGALARDIWSRAGVRDDEHTPIDSRRVGYATVEGFRLLIEDEKTRARYPLLAKIPTGKFTIPDTVPIKNKKFRDMLESAGATIAFETKDGETREVVALGEVVAIGAEEIMEALERAAAPVGHELGKGASVRIGRLREGRHPIRSHESTPFFSITSDLTRIGALSDAIRYLRETLPQNRTHAEAMIAAVNDLLTIQPAKTALRSSA